MRTQVLRSVFTSKEPVKKAAERIGFGAGHWLPAADLYSPDLVQAAKQSAETFDALMI